MNEDPQLSVDGVAVAKPNLANCQPKAINNRFPRSGHQMNHGIGKQMERLNPRGKQKFFPKKKKKICPPLGEQENQSS